MTTKVNPDLQKERNSASFNTEEFTLWWCGGRKKYEERKSLGKLWVYVYFNDFQPMNCIKKMQLLLGSNFF